MNTPLNRIGVSPAFLIASYGQHFTPEDVCTAMEQLSAWGFSNIQIEIFDEEKIPLWLEDGGARKVRQVKEKLGIHISQVVGHLLIDSCASPSALNSPAGISEMRFLVEIAQALGGVNAITLPVGSLPPGAPEISDTEVQEHFLKKLRALYAPVQSAGYQMAVELLPHHILHGYAGFRRVLHQMRDRRIGVLLDTGHAHAAGEDLPSIPKDFQGRVMGTHLCDNFARESLKLAPGKGNIDWPGFIRALTNSQFSGYYDVEIICRPEDVEQEYRESQAFLAGLLQT